MPQQNVELVRRMFAALNEGGVDALIAFVPEDGLAYTAPEWIEGSEYRGEEGLRYLLSIWTDNFDDWTVELVELRDAGDSVVALVEHGGRIKGTTTPISQPMGIVYSDFRDGQVGQARFFQTWPEAIAAAGLEPR